MALFLMVCSAPIVHGAQYLTVNKQPVDSIILEVGQSCFFEVVSDDSGVYTDVIGFEDSVVLGSFLHYKTTKEAGDSARVTPIIGHDFYGYEVTASGFITPPSPGTHFIFEYQAQEPGETDLVLKDGKSLKVLDSVHIRIVPDEMGTAFTYQGRLIDSSTAADGEYDFEFELYDAPFAGGQLGSTIDVNDLDVIDGYFTVELDFGSDVFDGNAVWLEIGVRPGELNDPNVYTTLSPRQELTPTPYALYAETAGYAQSAGGIPGGISGSGTANYIAKFTGSDTLGDSAIYEEAGNVGIGTASPGARLEVNGQVKVTGGSPAAGKVLTSDAGGLATWQTPSIGGDSDWLISGSDMYSIPSGNVGIGTTTPAAKLDVSGDISASSVYKIGGNTVLSVAGGNTLVGIAAGAVNTGNCNTFSGYQAGYSNTTGYGNTFSGNQAGYNNTEGYANTFSGYWTGFNNTTGHGNTFSGLQAGYSNTTGIYNTFSGHQAGVGNTTGHDNTFSGYMAGYSNTTGNYNTFSGYQAGRSNTTGHDNTFSGYMAGYSNTTGNYNTFSGDRAGYSNMEGGANTFTGHMAGYNNTTGCCNTFSGLHAGLSNTEGTGNTFSGHQAGLSNTEGTGNTFSGASAGYYNTTGTGNVFIGSNAGYYETGSTKLYIDNSGTSTPLIHGDFSTDRVGINRVSTANTLEVGGNASKTTAGGWLANSDARIKTDIQTVTGALDTLDKVRLVSFKYTDDYRNQHRSIEDQTYLNVVAQEFAEVFPDYVKSSGEKLHNGEEILQVDSYPLTIYSAAAVQELHTIVKAKDAEIAALKKHNDQMEARLATMEAAISKLISSEQGGQL